MAVLLVSLNLKPGNEHHNEIMRLIKSLDNWVKISETSYAVTTRQSPDLLGSRIRPLIGTDEQVHVFTLGQHYYEYGQNNVKHWLDTYLAENHPEPRFAALPNGTYGY
jgi:hypothetical protein